MEKSVVWKGEVSFNGYDDINLSIIDPTLQITTQYYLYYNYPPSPSILSQCLYNDIHVQIVCFSLLYRIMNAIGEKRDKILNLILILLRLYDCLCGYVCDKEGE